MSLETQELMQDHTFSREVWSYEPMWLGGQAAKASVATTFNGNFMSGPQNMGTNILPNFSKIVVTLPSSSEWINFSTVPQNSAFSWAKIESYESPPLTEEELFDIGIAINEVESGKAKHFKKLRDAFEWLDTESE